MAEKDQGAKAIIQMRPADFIKKLLPDTEYLGPLETDVATEPQLVLDTLHASFRGVTPHSSKEAQREPDTACQIPSSAQ